MTEKGKAPASEDGGFCEARKIPGYGSKYLVSEDGRVLRLNDDDIYEDVAQRGDPPRVTLYRLGKRYRPYVHSLVEELFGEDE